MVTVDRSGGRLCFRSAHARYFIRLEPVGLEVGETPVGIAETRPHRRGGTVGFDRFLLAAERLERMRDRQMQLACLQVPRGVRRGVLDRG